MYIIQNAFKSIIRNKGRNILIGIIVLVIATSACVALSIRQAAQSAKESTLSEMSVTAQISYDRTAAMEEMRGQMDGENPGESGEKGGFDRGKFNFEDLQGENLTLEDYITCTEALKDGDGYYYTMTSSLNASGDLLPYGTEEDGEDSADNAEAQQPEMGGMDMRGDAGGMNGGFKEMTVQGDFSLTGYSSYDAMMTLFGQDGACTITEGQMFSEDDTELNCVISDELAMYNNLSVGDTVTLENPNCEEETYTLTVCGIYTNSSSDRGGNPFRQTDPANNIYLSYGSLASITEASESAANVTEDSNGNETSAVLASNLEFTYTFENADNYYAFEKSVRDLGLSEDYTVSSGDISAFENSLTPLETLSTMAGWFFVIVLIIGAVVLVVINIFNLRERKYEVGVLTAIGMKKFKVALQFVFELFTVTFAAILIGAIIGASVSVPVTNALLQNQIQSAESSSAQTAGNFGFEDSRQMKGGTDIKGGAEGMQDMPGGVSSYIDSVTSATNITVILQLIAVGLILTVVSSLAAVITIMRYEPLKILSSRS